MTRLFLRGLWALLTWPLKWAFTTDPDRANTMVVAAGEIWTAMMDLVTGTARYLWRDFTIRRMLAHARVGGWLVLYSANHPGTLLASVALELSELCIDGAAEIEGALTGIDAGK
jgi:hypothetical protein